MHKNVIATLGRLQSIEDDEEKNAEKRLEDTKKVHEFYAKSGQRMAHVEPDDIAKYWRGPDCVLEIDVQGCQFHAVGSYERVGNLSALATAFGQPARQPPIERYQVEYIASRIAGGVFRARVTRTKQGDTAVLGLLGSMDNEANVIMLLTEDKNEFQVMETTKGSPARFYTLTLEKSWPMAGA